MTLDHMNIQGSSWSQLWTLSSCVVHPLSVSVLNVLFKLQQYLEMVPTSLLNASWFLETISLEKKRMWNADRRANSQNDKVSSTHSTTANKWLDTACWNLKIYLSCQRTTKASVRSENFQTRLLLNVISHRPSIEGLTNAWPCFYFDGTGWERQSLIG